MPPNFPCGTYATFLFCVSSSKLDWRPVLPLIEIECLNCIGKNSGVFPPEGCATVGQLIPDCANVFFDASNHWLYIEEAEKFNNVVIDFIKNGNSSRKKSCTV